jgi:hypothetical protein
MDEYNNLNKSLNISVMFSLDHDIEKRIQINATI